MNIQILMNNVEHLANQLISTEFIYHNRAYEEVTTSARDLGYRFKWNTRTKSAFGRCNYSTKIIELSTHLVANNLDNMEQIKDTILHEIAHAIAGRGNGHNWYWKRIAKEIGCNGERCYKREDVNQGQTKYTLECPCGKRSIGLHRRPKYNKSCGSCSNGRFNPDYEMKLVQNY